MVDAALRSISHPWILAAGDAAATPPLAAGVPLRMSCQSGMPTGAHCADTVLAELADRAPEPLDFGYIHQPISLGRRDGLIQFVDRADAPKDRILTGRAAAAYKEVLCRSAVLALPLERRLPGSTRWVRAGARAEGLPRPAAAHP